MSQSRLILHVMLLAVLLSIACATRPPGRQSFVSIDTPHFEILSSFGEERTLLLARRLESFHTGAARVIGADTKDRVDPRRRVRVLAFDDRSPDRPFALRAQAAYFLPTLDNELLVFRASGSWLHRGSGEQRSDYAQWLFRRRYGGQTPLWLESGLSAVAGGVGVRADEIRIGGPIPKYVREIRKKHQSNLDWVLRATDLSEISGGRRARFEAHAWSIAHIFYFGVGNPDGTRETFARALDLLASESTAANGQEVIAELTSGRGERLARLASEYVKAGQYRVEVLKPPAFREESFEVRPLAQQRSLVELGFLALSLDRPKLARSHFRRAEAIDPGNARALAGLALASVNRFSKAEVLARRADAQGSDDPLVQTWLGRFYALSASGATGESERKRRLGSARSHFSRSIELDESGVMPRLAMGLTYLLPGEDVESGQAWLAAAERLRPESLDVELARARLYMRLGRDAEAKQQAQHVVSRSRSAELRKQALGILDSLKTVSR